jgi:hypothetical protein
MLRHGLFALFVFVLCFGFVAAEEIKGTITKIDDKGVTVVISNDTTRDTKTYSYAKDCKFFKMVKKTKEEIKDGVKADEFQNISAKKGLNATITTNDKNEVTEVVLSKKKKKAAL